MAGFAKAIWTAAGLAMLACLAQFLWQSWSYGQTVPDGSSPGQSAPAETSEKFAQFANNVSQDSTPRLLSGATLEMRSEATIEGADVKLKQICRWPASDNDAVAPIADLVVAHMKGTAFRAITLSDLKSTLSDAGVNMAVIRFAGATHCTISRSDAANDEHAALQDWVNARLAVGPATQPSGEATLVAAQQPPSAAAPNAYHTLRDLLTRDLSERLSIDPNSLEMHFSPGDDKVLGLSEPLFQFNIEGQRVHNIGDVSWDVTIFAAGTKASTQKTTISAIARVWQEQLMVRRPMAYHQTIRSDDLTSRRTLIDQLDGQTLMKRDQVIGQLCARQLEAGTVLTSRLIEAAPLAKIGDLVTVTLTQGNVKVTTVVRAMDGGSYGQSIHGKQESTGAMFDVTLTGPKTGEISPQEPAQTASANVINN